MIKETIEMYNSSYFLNIISQELKITLQDVLNILEDNIEGFHYKGAKTFDQPHLKAILIEYIDHGTSSKIIAKKYGHCSKTILKILHDNNLALRPSGIQKIFQKDEPNIIKMYTDQIPTKIIASTYKVNPGAIINVLRKNNIEIKKYIPTIESRQASRKYTCNTNYFSTLDSSDKTYFLGLFASDGTFLKKDNKLIGISIGLKESSSEILDIFLKKIESNDNLRLGKTKYTYNGETRILYQKIAAVYSSVFAEDIRSQLELPYSFSKTFDLIYPTTIPTTFERHFCRGIFDGDGTIDTQSNKICFYGTKKILEGIRKAICKNCPVSFIEIKPKITKSSKADNHLFELAWSGKRQILAILDWMYTDTDLYLREKYEKYKSISREKMVINITDFVTLDEISNIRKKLRMSQLALARNISCSGSVICDLERNIRTTMSTPIAKRLLDFLLIDYDEDKFLY